MQERGQDPLPQPPLHLCWSQLHSNEHDHEVSQSKPLCPCIASWPAGHPGPFQAQPFLMGAAGRAPQKTCGSQARTLLISSAGPAIQSAASRTPSNPLELVCESRCQAPNKLAPELHEPHRKVGSSPHGGQEVYKPLLSPSRSLCFISTPRTLLRPSPSWKSGA